MKNTLKIITIIFCILTITFIGKVYYESKLNNVSLTTFNPVKQTLNKKVIENYFSKNEKLKKEAESIIKEVLLKDLGYKDWSNYSEYIELLVYPVDIIDTLEEDLVIGVNLSKDLGAIAIYKPYNDKYVYSHKIDNLTKIKNISFIKNESDKKSFIIVEELLDEQTGSYFIDNFTRIFTKVDNQFKEVFRQSTDYTAFLFEKWTNPSLKNPKWFKLVEKSVIDHVSEGTKDLTLFVSKNLSKYESKDTDTNLNNKQFDLVTEKNFDTIYIWKEKYKFFIMGEGKVISSNEIVGIIEDNTQTVDYLLNLGDKYYKVINRNGEIKTIKSSEIEILENYSDKKPD
ncbi:hypothetical protein CLPU_3c01540 [Gottschalkia purinilytica]|uniref:Uncharacterized protein n=1 Tax=Gottschalkia purinilytica TaxID=1503 RepID=A0A0L0WD62_GOTPU|nr:hypothetical protein [Gottschalkia purinilytica]KNF09376.1 hypothetical protein CLPU_3c01540 [Gottschalkia purinilytica]